MEDYENHNRELHVAYPEIISGITSWVWTDGPDETPNITVARDGLRRVLRAIRVMQEVVILRALGQECANDKLAAALNASSKVWCEGDLVVSGLFVDDDGNPIVHPNPEIAGEESADSIAEEVHDADA